MLTDEEISTRYESDFVTESDRRQTAVFLLEEILITRGSDTGRRIKKLLFDSDLWEKLLQACSSRRFEDVREALRKEFELEDQVPLSPAKVAPSRSTMNCLQQSFEAPFVGEAQDGLFSYLEEKNSLFKDPHTPKYYGKFCSIVQSSGTGKSRAMIELRTRGVIVLYINIRSEHEGNVFPPRDHLLADVLTKFPGDEEEYAKRCCALFTAIFRALRGAFTDYMDSEKTGGMAPVEAWNKAMCNFASGDRERFFQGVMKIYQTVLIEIESEIDKNETTVSSQPKNSDINPTSNQVAGNGQGSTSGAHEDPEGQEGPPQADGMRPSSSETRFKSDGPTKPIVGEKSMTREYEEWIAFSKEMPLYDEDSNKPQLVIGLDEAHILSDMVTQGYRPSHILCRVISAYSRRSIPTWVLFASTTSQVADFSAPAVIFNSLRVSSGGELLFPPYLHLGWDQHAKDIRSVPPNKVSEFGYIASLGRPLWRSLMNVQPSVPPLMETVREKLCGSARYDPKSGESALAVLGARFCLDVCLGHHECNMFHTQAVASHLRVLQKVTADRVWQTTEYPSEPLLACAAADILRLSTDIRDTTISTLHEKIKSGMIDTGRRGELTSRLVLLIAKDLYVGRFCKEKLESQPKDPWAVSLRDCRPIPVVDFLEFLFGPEVWKAGGKDMFQDWYLNFSHWISMDKQIWMESSSGLPGRSDFTQRHWYRTSGVQCSHNQRFIDKVIPIYYDPPADNNSSRSTHRYSQILVSDKAKKSPSRRDLELITPRSAIGCESQEPYIAILLDLGVQRVNSVPVAPILESDCLRIYATGMTTSTFPFLSEHSNMFEKLRDILMLEDPENEKDLVIARLAAKSRVGKTVANENMLWDVEPEDFDSYNEATRLPEFWQG